MKKIRVLYWIFVGFVKKHTLLLLIGIVLGVIGALSLPRIISIAPEPRLRQKIAVIGKPTLAQLPKFIQNEISLGLTSITPSGEATPSLSTKYTVEDNGKQFRFTLRDDLFWHDGKKFTAEDINYNFTDVTTEIISDSQVVFKLKEPFSPFPTIVSQPLFRQSSSQFLPQKTKLLGLGKMKVTSISRNAQFITELVLESNDEIKDYRFYNTQETAILAFKLGEVDKILELSNPGELASWPNTTVEEVVHKDRYIALFFNTQDDYLSSKTFRQALTYAIPNKVSDSHRVISPINPDSWAFNPQVKPYEYNIDTTKKLLESEKEGRDNFSPKIELTTTIPYLSTAEYIKDEWSSLGLETTVRVATFIPEHFQALLIGQEIPPDPDQYSLWHSTQQTNLTQYNSPKVDKLLEDGRQTLDKKERTQIYQEFQRFLVEDTPAAFLLHYKTYTITRS